MKNHWKWIIGIIIEHILIFLIAGVLWGSLTTKVDNVVKQSDKMETKIDKIYDILIGD